MENVWANWEKGRKRTRGAEPTWKNRNKIYKILMKCVLTFSFLSTGGFFSSFSFISLISFSTWAASAAGTFSFFSFCSEGQEWSKSSLCLQYCRYRTQFYYRKKPLNVSCLHPILFSWHHMMVSYILPFSPFPSLIKVVLMKGVNGISSLDYLPLFLITPSFRVSFVYAESHESNGLSSLCTLFHCERDEILGNGWDFHHSGIKGDMSELDGPLFHYGVKIGISGWAMINKWVHG